MTAGGSSNQKLALVGDSHGIPILRDAVPTDSVACIVAAHNRPNCMPALTRIAAQMGVPLIVQPAFGTSEYQSFLKDFAATRADSIACYSYALIVRPDLLEMVNGRAVNFHAALLPRNRGPNPIQWAIIHGESETGVTMHFMNETIDAGDIVAQRSCPITDSDTWVTVKDRLVTMTRELICEQLPLFLSGKLPRTAQDESFATTNTRLTPDSPRIDFQSMDDRQVFNLIRAQVAPLRGAYIQYGDLQERIDHFLNLDAVSELRIKHGRHSSLAGGRG